MRLRAAGRPCLLQLAERGAPPGSSSAALLLIYGFPITLLGFALSYAQLKPVPCKTTDDALRLRESQATDIQKSVSPLPWRGCVAQLCKQGCPWLSGWRPSVPSTWPPTQVREDVTRYRYGDEQHLDEALNRVLMLGRPKGVPRRCLAPAFVHAGL